MQILAATDFSTRSNRALRQAGLLAGPVNAQLHIVHVVDDDQPEELIAMEKREAERLLQEQASSMPELRGVQTSTMVVSGDPFDGILRAAARMKADLIVMGSHRKHLLLDIFTGTTIERVIRNGTFPVLMVNNEAQRKYERVVIPTDMSDVSARAVRTALSTGLISGAGATVLHGFLPMAKGKLTVAGSDQAAVDEYVANERNRATSEVAEFMVANELGDRGWQVRIEEGAPMEVIARAIPNLQPDLLVMGTHGRTGLLKTLIGSVTEEALRSIAVDILAVRGSNAGELR
jgi:nucleotide-binding universal stress UspA family protein